MTLQDGIALGVGDDGSNADGAEIKQRISDLGRNSVVAEFDKQILPLSDGVVLGSSESIRDIFVGQVKIAAQAKGHNVANAAA